MPIHWEQSFNYYQKQEGVPSRREMRDMENR